jgi:RNA polymerase sigma factor (sigma-70 family)
MMDELSQAERYLLEHVRTGDADAWAQLVSRYQGRLCAFARSRGAADAEDLVQETFLQFLTGLHAFRGESSVETYLFTILRRRIADHARASNRTAGQDAETLDRVPARDATASVYAIRDEGRDAKRGALAAALADVVGRLKADGNLTHLKVLEMLLSVQARNKDVATATGLSEQQVALIKHRSLNQLHDAVLSRLRPPDRDAEGRAESLLTEIWQELRPTCPKRSTLGRHCLGTLEEPWRDYVEFHLSQVECGFCLANVDDLKAETAAAPIVMTQHRFQSTIGFFKPPPKAPGA